MFMALYKMKVSCYFEVEVEAEDSKSAVFSVENDSIQNLIKSESDGGVQSIIVKDVKKLKE